MKTGCPFGHPEIINAFTNWLLILRLRLLTLLFKFQ